MWTRNRIISKFVTPAHDNIEIWSKFGFSRHIQELQTLKMVKFFWLTTYLFERRRHVICFQSHLLCFGWTVRCPFL